MAEEKEKTIETPDKVGRPTGLTADVIKSARYYLENWQKIDPEDVLPTIESLSLYLEVARKTLYNWANDENNEEFLHIFEKIQVKQAKILLSKGLKGDFNSTITKLMLTKHNYVDKVETENKHTVNLSEDKKQALDKILETNDKQISVAKNDNGDAGGESISGK